MIFAEEATELAISPKTGDFVAFASELQWWIAEVLAIDKEQDDVKLNVMHPPGPAEHFYWPDTETMWTSTTNVLKIISFSTSPKIPEFTITKELSDELDLPLDCNFG